MTEATGRKASPTVTLDPLAPLVVIATATMLALVVFTAPLTTLEAMTDALALSAGEQAWTMSGMPLGAAAGLLFAGALGDTTGRRRTLLGGLWLTALSSALAALAWSGPVLIAARILQGLGSAGIMACGLGIVGTVYRGAAQRRAAGIWAAALGAGVAVGPILASLMLGLAGWAAIHWVLAIFAAGLAVVGVVHLPESPRARARVDVAGGLLLMIAMGCALGAMTELRVGSPVRVAILAALAAVALLIFLTVERRSGNPVLQIGLFLRPDFAGATLAALASGAGVLALMSLVPTVLVRGFGVGPLSAAVILLAWSGLTVVAALYTGWLPERLSSRDRVVIALLGCMVGQLLLWGAHEGATWRIVLPGLLVAGISNGILNAALGHAAVQSVPSERSAMGSAANNTARYLGSAMGIAVISLLIAAPGPSGFFTGWHRAVALSALVSLGGAIAVLALSRRHA
ncbi:MFS transporter [Allosediminivita pacifica]|uniref:MFS transporter n=1 Tax=Allosediminivita pacifica TaxID=1267769 RepID=A0A2T6A6C9_9RHOB|nr:MFS transporter [Allosediminivita pacifica]PTX39390.1 MFS transporter [Allosediminivita pacifica]GGB28029.1 MFS transporter [Allosediminivita pacifica]